MKGFGLLTLTNDVARKEFCGFGYDCVLTAVVFTVTGSALPDEFF